MPLYRGSRRLILRRKPPSTVASPLIFTWTDSFALASTPVPPATFTAKNIGTASSDRFVVVGVSWNSTAHATNPDITSVTVDGGAGGGVIPLTQAVYSRPSAGAHAHAIWYGNVPTGTTNATIVVTGYVNGWVNSIVVNVGNIKGSATTTNASGNNSTAPAFSNGLTTSPSLTVPTNGVTIIEAYGLTNPAGVSSWTNATLDKDQWDGGGGSIFVLGSMAHLTASATVTETGLTNTSSGTGWVAAAFQP